MAAMELTDTTEITDPKEKAREQLENLLRQLPAEATGVYILGVSLFQDSRGGLLLAFISGLILLAILRYRARASTLIWTMSIVGYFVWAYGIGDGPINALADNYDVHRNLPTFLVGLYSAAVAVITVKPKAVQQLAQRLARS